MKKFARRIGRTKFLLLCFIPLGVAGFYLNGRLGLAAVMLGWCLGIIIYNRRENKQRLVKFLRRLTKLRLILLVKGIILVPIVAACTYYNGLPGFLASLLGIVVGQIICRRWLNLP